MNAQVNQEINRCLAELSIVVDYYDPRKELYIGAMLLSLNAIGLIVILEVGILLGILLLVVGVLPILYKALTSKDDSPSTKELAERACLLMSHCINWHKYPDNEARRMILDYSFDGNNQPLYEEFISIFPHMASKKLKRLASIHLRR